VTGIGFPTKQTTGLGEESLAFLRWEGSSDTVSFSATAGVDAPRLGMVSLLRVLENKQRRLKIHSEKC